MAKMENENDSVLEEAQEKFRNAQDGFETNMRRFEDDVRFSRAGQQWEENDLERRRKEGRPALTVNRLPSFVRQVVNDARQNKPSIRVHPIDNNSDPETSEVINGVIRNIENVSKADLAYDTAIDNAASGGFGYIRVDVDYCDTDTFDMDIKINRVLNPLTVYPDPNSIAADSSDWDCCFVTDMLTEDEFKEAYPDAEQISWSFGEEYDSDWYDTGEKLIRVAEYWKRTEEEYEIHQLNNGEVIDSETYNEIKDDLESLGFVIVRSRKSTKKRVVQYILNGKEILETNEWQGKYIPIVPVYGEEVYIDGERNFYGLTHFAKDSQRMYNYWRTTTTELVALAPKAPWVGPVGAFETDIENWQRANTETIPILEYDGDIPPQRQPFAGPPAGALQEALNASDDMKAVMGLHDASMGAQSNEIAGVAISKRVREGDTSTFHFVDNLARAIRHVGVIIVDLIPHIYNENRIVRIIGADEQPQTVRINGEFTREDEMLQGENIERMEAIRNVYDLRTGKYDVTVKSGPSYTTQREEARESMIALLQAFPQAAQVTGDLVVAAMDWPNADIFAKRLKALLPPGIIDEEQDPQAAQLAQQVEQMDAVIQQLMAGKEEAMAKIAVDREKLSLDAEKLRIDAMKAETDRMKAEVDAELKRNQLDLEAAKAARVDPVDDTAVTVKTMELNHDQAKTEVETSLEQQRIELERQKLQIEQQKLDLDRYKAEIEAIAKTTPQVDVGVMPEMEVEREQKVQVFNVQSGKKNIKINRGPNGEIMGAEVDEE